MNKQKLVKLACSMKVKDIIEELKDDTDKDLYQKYLNRFVDRIKETHVEDDELNDIINVYCDYYREVFYDLIDNEIAIESLKHHLVKHLRLDDSSDMKTVENHIQNIFNDKGYHFRGGTTSEFYGPYIWKETKKEEYDVEIPEGMMKLPIFFMYGFIHNSWLNYISYKNVATGGWSTNEGIHCVYERYEEHLGTPKFNISFLKHESQHNKDYMNNDWNFTVPVLEYRAKLCEIAYYPDTKRIEEFINTADKNSNHGHSEAEYWVIHDLSKDIFQVEFETDIEKWKDNLELVQEKAKEYILSYRRGEKNRTDA